MATTKKIIGRVPVFRGAYEQEGEYHRLNIVSHLGSSFVSLVDGNKKAPCVVENNAFVLNEGWAFLADASYSYLKESSEVDISMEEFEALQESGQLDESKTYYIYE